MKRREKFPKIIGYRYMESCVTGCQGKALDEYGIEHDLICSSNGEAAFAYCTFECNYKDECPQYDGKEKIICRQNTILENKNNPYTNERKDKFFCMKDIYISKEDKKYKGEYVIATKNKEEEMQEENN